MTHLVVYKYDLPLTSAPCETLPIKLPCGAQILRVGEQGADPLLGPRLFIWALVDPDEQEEEQRYVLTAGTGHKIEVGALSQRWAYQETVICLGGQLVVHVWITQPEPAPLPCIEMSQQDA